MILTYKQLAFLLDIKPLEAMEKIIYAHCKENEKVIPKRHDGINDYKKDNYPQEIELSILEKHSGLQLSAAIKDIQENYLKRASSKKYILCDYPEKELLTKNKNEIKMPSALESLLHPDTVATIKTQWRERYGIQHRSEK